MKLTDTIRAALARDGEADPQARDEEFTPWQTAVEVDRSEPERGEIEDWTTEYEENVLIRKPTQKFTSDVLEPGVRVELGIGEDDDIPTVAGSDNDDLNGLDLDDALERWLQQAGIVDGEFNKDLRDVLEKIIKDLVARRGTAMIETVYDDATEQDRIMGLRPFKVETVTAYTREGKNILLQPDDTPEDVDFDQNAPNAPEDPDRRGELPQTPAGETACYVQFDHTFGSWDDDEVRFAQDDVVKLSNDADTGEIFGTPDAASVYDRAHSIRQQYKDLDQALKAVAYSHFVAKVDTDDEEEAKKLLDGFDPANPEKVNVVYYGVEVDHHSGEIPTVDSTLKQEIEYVLSAFPVPIYRIGFEGEINRDVTSEQSDDYQRELSDWRTDIGDALSTVLQAKAEELVDGDAPDVQLVIAPKESENPLEDESFDADAFSSTMQGISALAGPGQSPTSILPAETVLETFLGLDADEVLGGGADDAEAGLEPLDEADPLVNETFQEYYAAALASFSEGDEVETPDGVGVVVEVRTSEFEGPDGDDVDASEDDPAYIVATEDGAAVYRTDDLEEGSIDVGMDDPEAALALDIGCDESALLQEGHFSWPESWKEADQPARLIALKAWAGLGGRFTTCRREMAGEIASPSRFCAAFKDRILGWEGWRQGG
jgi:hypothetical protein